MESIIMCTIFGVFILLSYSLGLRNGQHISKQEPVEVPEINPQKIIQRKNIEKRQQKEIENFNKILANIDNYDGTGANQEEV